MGNVDNSILYASHGRGSLAKGKDSIYVCLDYCHSKAAITNKANRTQNQSINTKIQEPRGTIISGGLLNICSGLGILHALSDFMLTCPWGRETCISIG